MIIPEAKRAAAGFGMGNMWIKSMISRLYSVCPRPRPGRRRAAPPGSPSPCARNRAGGVRFLEERKNGRQMTRR
jgi:hypothetical protein